MLDLFDSLPSFDDPVTDVDFTVLDEGAVVLSGLDLRTVMHRVRNDLNQAKAKKAKIDDEAYKDRQAYDLDEKVQEYEGQPNITMPLTRNKTDGVIGHLTEAVNQDPFFTAIAHTEEAAEIAPVYSAAM